MLNVESESVENSGTQTFAITITFHSITLIISNVTIHIFQCSN
jgi:hypothetical protein